MKKRKLAVLFGGCSSEYDISLQSAHAVLTHLDPGKYEPVPLGITRDGRWFLYQGPFDALLDDSWHTDERHLIPAVISPRRAGDPAQLVASSEKAKTILGWKPQYDDLETIIASAWKWHESHPNGYGK